MFMRLRDEIIGKNSCPFLFRVSSVAELNLTGLGFMKGIFMKLVTGLFAGIFGISTLMAQSTASAQMSPAATNIVAGGNAFALDLYAQLKAREGNLFFSPYSISTCLGMVYLGAHGDTGDEMAETLHWKVSPAEIAAPMGELRTALNAVQQEKGIELNTANGLWAQQGHPFLPTFLEAAQNSFGAVVKQVDFKTQAEPARMKINGWVSDQTKGKIKDLLAPGVLTPATRLVLVNAIYFKGRWTFPFNKKKTADAPFTTASGQSVQARMMNLEAHFNYTGTDNLQLLELPYTSGDNSNPLSMIILLPKKADGLAQLESSFKTRALDNWLTQMRSEKVRVFLPKFTTTAEFSLGDTLSKMGIRDAFSSWADFSGIDGKKDLYISAVVHKAYVDVNEEGTEAAAATGVAVTASAVRIEKNIVFRADHPFIFLIRDNRTGSILFLGRVNDPTK